MNRIPVWFDTDIGVDDAVAFLVMNKLPQLEVKGISAVAGNVELSHTYPNARNICAFVGADYPVYKGADHPLLRDQITAPYVHGVDGLGEATLAPSPAPHQTKPAWDALYEAAVAAKGELQVIAVGPLTNIATTLGKYPQIKPWIKRLLIMGGSATKGNTTPAAEFNIYADPHAAQVVFKSGIPIVMCGLDVTTAAYLTPEEVAEIGRHGTDVCRFFLDSTRLPLSFAERGGRKPGLCLHDVCPVLYLTHPQLFQGQEAGVFVETQSTICNGKTVTDLWSDKKFPRRNVLVVLDVDRPAFAGLVRDLLTNY